MLMFSDHMEVYSPGRLPGHVTLDNLVTERFSRNEAIAQALSDLGFVERLGYGIDRMVASMAEAGLPAPAFEETVAGFRVTLRGRGEELVSLEASPRWGNRRLNPRQERAVAHLAEHGTITNREFRRAVPRAQRRDHPPRAGRPGGSGTHRQGRGTEGDLLHVEVISRRV